MAYPAKPKKTNSARPYDAKSGASAKDQDKLMQKPWHKANKAKAGGVSQAAEHAHKPPKANANTNANAPREAGQKVPKISQLKQQDLQESRVHGENACRVCYQQRPGAIVKMYLQPEFAAKFADVMKYLAANKKAYHLVDSQELEKIAGSQHHGGVVFVVKKRDTLNIGSYLTQHKAKKQDCLLALDGVGNPHNLGAIVRSAAHFGVNAVLMTEPELLQSGAAARTAEGGLEYVNGISCDNLSLALQLCKQAGYTLISTSSHAGNSLYNTKLPAKVVVVFGEEMAGVSKSVASHAEIALQIPGTGQVESLNVSVAASLILGEWYRQQHQ